MKMQAMWIIICLCMLRYARTEIFDQKFEKDLERFVKKTMECRHIPGLTVSVVKGSQTWTRGYGKADISQGHPVDNATQFVIGSVTKSFTMVLLGVLLTENGLDWNAKIHDILGPKYKFIDEYRSKEATLRDLLSHRTGLPSLNILLLAGYPASLTREKLTMKLKYWPQQQPFRDTFIYSNYLFMVLGHVAEKLGGDTWENLLTAKVLQPIGMTSTRILKDPRDVIENGVAKPYIFKDNTFQNGSLEIYNLHLIEPAGALLSTGEDMAKYIRFNLKGGVTDDGTSLLDRALLSKAFLATIPIVSREFLSRHFLTRPEFPVADTTFGYGYAWFTGTYRGYRKVWHSGGLFSYFTYLWMFPDINAGVFASINGPSFRTTPQYGVQTILYYITDKLMKEKQWLNVTNTCEFPQLWRHETTNSTPIEQSGQLQNPSEYTGYYCSQILPGVNVTRKFGDDSSLLFQMNRLGGVFHSTQDKDRFLAEFTSPWEYMMFTLDANNSPILINSTFRRNGEGIVISLEVQYEVKVVYTRDVSILRNRYQDKLRPPA